MASQTTVLDPQTTDRSPQPAPTLGGETPEFSPAMRWHVLRSGIGLHLLALILMFSSLVTLVLTGLQLYLDYRRDVESIEVRLGEIERSYGSSLGAGLWNLDVVQLELQLKGIARLPDVRAVELREEAGGIAAPLRIGVGERGSDGALIRAYPIFHHARAETRRVGTLYVEATHDGVYQRLWQTAEVILLSQAIKTFLVSFFILYIVHRVITRHLTEIARFVTRFDVRRAAAPLRLQRTPPHRPDELAQVVESFNRMNLHLRRAYADLEQANEELERDVVVRRSFEEKLQRQAHFDTLTGLPNRTLLLERLLYALQRVHRVGGSGALLSIDLDQFKKVNDTLGHGAGDELLKEAARRLATCVRERDTLARVGDDEFAVIVADLDRPEAAERLAERMLATFAEPFTVGGSAHHVTASVGITHFPADGTEPHVLLRNADLAMHKAKENGRNRQQLFFEHFNLALTEQLALESELRSALARNELVLYYQPIVDIRTGELAGREALLRWQRGNELRTPDRFIPQAEDMGIIADFGRWVVTRACADLAADTSAANLRVAVNVSPRQLQEEGFADFVQGELVRHDLSPERLELEITERVVMDDSTTTESNLKLLCALGVRLSIDDFGTGYSSLGYLQKYPFNTLKIDRAFVSAALNQKSAARLVETIIAMGRGLDLEVIAEGVETQEQQDFLIAAGCDLGQGYFFGRPAPL